MIIVAQVKDKTALITGAAQRIGADISRRLHNMGYRVAVHFNRSRDEATALVASLNAERADSAIAVQGDLTSAPTAPRLVEAVRESWGCLDLLVNNASIYEPSDVTNAAADCWERIMSTNLKAPYLLSTAALSMLRRQSGAIINLTDIYALRPQQGYAIYCASKAGLVGLTKALALDLSPDVRVNAVSPGPILWADGDNAAHRKEVLAKTPLGRLGAPNDISGAVCYLAAAPYVTGQVLEVDGGRSVFI